MAGASRSIVINAPVDKVFDVVTGYDAYPQFMKEAKEVKILQRSGNEVTVGYKVDLVLKTVKYTLKMKEERPSKVSERGIAGNHEVQGLDGRARVFQPAAACFQLWA